MIDIQAGGSDSPDPIIVLGAPRSGTSLLRVMLNRHPSIALCDETYFFYYVYNRRRVFGDLRETSARRHVIDKYLATSRIKYLGLNLDDLAETMMDEGTDYDLLFLSLLRFYASSLGKPRYGEKTPQHTGYVRIFSRWFPNCRMIHIVRDPRDVVASLMRMPWASKNILANARAWLKYSSGHFDVRDQENYLLVRYEQLVLEPEAELERICKFVGEEFLSGMLDASTGEVGKQWWFQRALEPVAKDRIGIWRKQLSVREVALIEMFTDPVMREFGYKPSGQAVPFLTKLTARVGALSSFVKEVFVDLPRLYYHWLRPTELAAEEAWIDSHRR